jgi:TorA maturation chaperone TorD
VVAEYNRLFGGVGKPEVYLYGSHYLSGFLNEKPLVKLRDDLAALGLGKGEGMSDTEDHVANLTHQMAFFSQHLQPWVPQMCQTLRAHPAAVFYAHLAAFTEAFLSVETQGFDLVA